MNKHACVLMMASFALAVGGAAGAADNATAAAVKARWQEHTLDLAFNGFTTHYSCSGIEDKVEEILLLLGARKGVQMRASACDPQIGAVSRFVWVKGKFETLEPVGEGPAADLVAARWKPIELSANRPNAMGEGDCELIEQLRPQLQKAFPQGELNYVARCTPYQVSLGSWHISGRVLQAERP